MNDDPLLRQIVECALRDWGGGSVDAEGLAFAVLRDLENHGYKISK
jgi:hypothetical protein